MLSLKQTESLTGISSARLMLLAEIGGIPCHRDATTKLPLFDPFSLKAWLVRQWIK
jgi:hypothetical protein